MSDFDRSSTDAAHWAKYFCRTLKEITMNAGKTVDLEESFMTGWFANYWAAVHDPLAKKIENLEGWNKEMHENHKIELARLQALIDRKASDGG